MIKNATILMLPAILAMLLTAPASAEEGNNRSATVQVNISVQPFTEIRIGAKTTAWESTSNQSPTVTEEFDVFVTTALKIQLVAELPANNNLQANSIEAILGDGTDEAATVEAGATDHSLSLTITVNSGSNRQYRMSATGEDAEVLIEETNSGGQSHQTVTLTVGEAVGSGD